jgi:hypothetical protein
MIDEAMMHRKEKAEEKHNLTINIRPEFAHALQEC